jgi:hypothetical protein
MTARLDQAVPGSGERHARGRQARGGSHDDEPGDDLDVPEFMPRE